MTFQCEGCWFINLEGRPPDPKLDEMYIKLIRRANLDAIGGRAVTTTQAHAAAVKMDCVQLCGHQKDSHDSGQGTNAFGRRSGNEHSSGHVTELIAGHLKNTRREARAL